VVTRKFWTIEEKYYYLKNEIENLVTVLEDWHYEENVNVVTQIQEIKDRIKKILEEINN